MGGPQDRHARFQTIRAGNLTVEFPPRHRTKVAIWLFVICAMIFAMIVLGGATRLTGSGLSIMEWAPIMGTLPPMSETEWQRLFALYQHIPQYELLNKGMGLEGFKHIFLLEYLHRLWGRLLGVAFLLPLLGFIAVGAIPRRFIPRLLLLFVLGGLQGAVGWFMVASGFLADSVAVEPARLVAHLMLALLLYGVLLWTALGVLHPTSLPNPSRTVRNWSIATVVLICITIPAGGFVAGLHAGLDYNTFPLMDGQLVPAGYAQLQPFWRNPLENIAAVQFDHRVLATLTLIVATLTAIFGRRAKIAPRAMALLALAALMQYALGVVVLLHVVPVPEAVAHQGMAVMLLTAALIALHPQRRI